MHERPYIILQLPSSRAKLQAYNSTYVSAACNQSGCNLQAVIGAGAAGLVAARELVREGHHVTVFEKGPQSGGVWVYTDDIESPDLVGESQILQEHSYLTFVTCLICV